MLTQRKGSSLPGGMHDLIFEDKRVQ